MFLSGKEMWFPDVHHAFEDGLLAIGGDLSAERLMLAYSSGIFPWFINQGLPFWYCPEERFVLFPEEVHISHSMKKVLHRQTFTVTENHNFSRVIQLCAEVHLQQEGSTWISAEFIEAYTELHHLDRAHSVEVWKDGELVGGLYGVVAGEVFCGESMFSIEPNASKTAMIHLCQSKKYRLIDCQVYTRHLESLGARMISRDSFLAQLKKPGNI